MENNSIIDFIKQQGFSIFILCTAIYWFNQKYDKQQEQIDTLNLYIRTELTKKLDENTQVMRDFLTHKKED